MYLGCVSNVYQGCILGASLVYLWVYFGVSGCIKGAAGGVSRRGVNGVAKDLHNLQEIEDLDASDTLQIHHINISGYTLDT